MKSWLLTAVLVISSVAHANERENKIKALMEAQGLLDSFQQQLDIGREQNRENVRLMLDDYLRDLDPPPAFQERFEQVFNRYVDELSSPWGADELVGVWAKYFGPNFSDEELDRLITFYSSELGQKEVIASQQAMTKFLMHFGEAAKPIIESTYEELSTELRSIVEECNCRRRENPEQSQQSEPEQDPLEILLEEAREFRKAGKYKQALDSYLMFFEQSQGTSYTGVRLSYVPSEIAAMGEEYPPALEALRKIRDVREQRIMDNKATRSDIHEWSSLSRYLGNPEYVLDQYDLLWRRGNADPVILTGILEMSWDNFIEAGRYREVEALAFEKLGMLNDTLASWDSYTDESYRADVRDAMTEYLVREYARVYQVLLATDNLQEAQSVRDRLLSVSQDGVTYHALISAARSAGKVEIAELLVNQAQAELSPEEYAIALAGKPKPLTCEETGSSKSTDQAGRTDADQSP